MVTLRRILSVVLWQAGCRPPAVVDQEQMASLTLYPQRRVRATRIAGPVTGGDNSSARKHD